VAGWIDATYFLTFDAARGHYHSHYQDFQVLIEQSGRGDHPSRRDGVRLLTRLRLRDRGGEHTITLRGPEFAGATHRLRRRPSPFSYSSGLYSGCAATPTAGRVPGRLTGSFPFYDPTGSPLDVHAGLGGAAMLSGSHAVQPMSADAARVGPVALPSRRRRSHLQPRPFGRAGSQLGFLSAETFSPSSQPSSGNYHTVGRYHPLLFQRSP